MARQKSEYTQRFCKSVHCGCKVSHKRGYNDEMVWGWICYNCGLHTPIRTRKASKPTENGLTKAQNKIVELLRKKLIGAFAGDESLYEYKTFKLTILEGFTTLTTEVGKIGDEGTVGEFYGRDRRHIAIGLNGALKLLNAKKVSQSKGLRNVLYATLKF